MNRTTGTLRRLLMFVALTTGPFSLIAQQVTRVHLSNNKAYTQLDVQELQRTLDSLNVWVGRLQASGLASTPEPGEAFVPLTGSGAENILNATHVCGEDLTFRGVTYATTRIGTQCWFAENLRTVTFLNGDSLTEMTTTNSSDVIPLGFENLFARPAPGNLESHGLYYAPKSARDARGICPSGWHVPDSMDFAKLVSFVGPYPNDLKSIDDGGADAYGFNWKLTGRSEYGTFSFAGQIGYLNSVTPNNESLGSVVTGFMLDEYSSPTAQFDYGGFGDLNFMHIRCLKD